MENQWDERLRETVVMTEGETHLAVKQQDRLREFNRLREMESLTNLDKKQVCMYCLYMFGFVRV